MRSCLLIHMDFSSCSGPCSLLCWCDQLCSGAINWPGQKLPWLFLPWVTFSRAELSDLAHGVVARGDELRAPWATAKQTQSHRTRTDVCPGAELLLNCHSRDWSLLPSHSTPVPAATLCVDLRWKGASWTSAFPHSKSTFKTSLVCWLHDFICIFILILLCCGKIETLLCKNVWCVIVIYICICIGNALFNTAYYACILLTFYRKKRC